MTFGEIKADALRLMGLEEPVDADNVSNYEDDENWAPLIRGMWSAVNRCMADLETKRVLPLRRRNLDKSKAKGKGAWRRFRYDEIDDLLEVVRLVVERGDCIDDDHPFLLEEDGCLRVSDFDANADYAVLYRPKLERLTVDSGNSAVVGLPKGKTAKSVLPDALAAAVPYFVKSEVYRADEPDEAGEARNFYEAAVEQYASLAEIGRQGTVQTVYAMP